MIIDCKNIAKGIKDNVKSIIESQNINVTFAMISVNADEASRIYLNNKIKACKYCGINFIEYTFTDINEEKLIEKIKELNNDNKINAIMVQLPLPDYINEEKILNTIEPNKDVDCLTYVNIGKLFYEKRINENLIMPCTAVGCIKIIKTVCSNLSGKKVVVIGRSNIVGKPVAQLLLQENCSVTILHSKSKNISEETKKADIIVIAIGKEKFLKKEMINENSIIIDVGINRTEKGICGDVDFNNIVDYCKYVTPVPNGVGQLTVACLMENIIKCFFVQKENE